MDDLGEGMAYMAGAFAAALLIAFAVSRLGLYLRRSSRFEPGTVVGVHILSFFLLGAVACSAGNDRPGSSAFIVLVAQAIIFLIDLLRLPRLEDYSDDIPQSLRPLAGARLVAVIASVLLGFALVYGVARAPTDRELIADLEAGVRKSPGGAVYLEALKRNFPEEYRALALDTVHRLRALQARGEKWSEIEQQLGGQMGHRIIALVADKAPAMAKAPTPALNAYSRAMKDHAVALKAASARACVALVDGPGPGPQAPLPPAAQEVVAKIMAARLDLARAGLDRPTDRKLSPPPEEALGQLRAEMHRRDAELMRVAEAFRGTSLPTRQGCDFAVLYYSVIADLPSEAGALAAAYDLSAPSA